MLREPNKSHTFSREVYWGDVGAEEGDRKEDGRVRQRKRRQARVL